MCSKIYQTSAFLGCLLVSTLNTTPMSADEASPPESLKQRVSYSYGLMIAKDLTERGIKIDFDQFASAFQTMVEGGESLLSYDEMTAAFDANQKILDERKKILDERSATGTNPMTARLASPHDKWLSSLDPGVRKDIEQRKKRVEDLMGREISWEAYLGSLPDLTKSDEERAIETLTEEVEKLRREIRDTREEIRDDQWWDLKK